MKIHSRILVVLFSLALITAYFTPIWSIDLDAPQYPDGLGMKINISSIGGELNIINGLNHYIGMKEIIPDAIPELKMMPYILGVLIIFGILTGIAGNKKILVFFVLFFLITGIAGGVDFYLWEYDYGHDLDPHAAIKMEGIDYQPPLWGTRQLLNFTAYSYPATGGYTIIWSGVLLACILLYELRSGKKKNNIMQMNYAAAASCLFFPLLFASCTSKPVPLNYGKDACDFCKMILSDKRFGGELITQKGKTYKFDAVECMVNFMEQNNRKKKTDVFETFLTVDYSAPGKLIDARISFYFHSPELPSPMGMFLTSFESEQHIQNIQMKFQGKKLTWNEVIELVKNAEQISSATTPY